jgi:membrane associated rhomboid family serine protease
MLLLFNNLTEDQANLCGLVLSSSGLSHRLMRANRRWDVWVHDNDYEEALKVIEQYLKENQDFHQADEALSHEYRKTFTGLWVSAALLMCHVAVTMGNDRQALIRDSGSSAFHILRGELYRTVTSLTLHGSALHLAGNMVGIALFGTAVCTVTGWGVGWFMILAAGIAGNLVNALLYKTGHLSVGASTAVFGAIGILVGQQIWKKFRLPSPRIKAWVTLGGGLALLGILGSGQYADLTAHLFGFLAGIFLGLLYAVFIQRPAARAYQVSCAAIALGVLAMSWMRALGYIGQG